MPYGCCIPWLELLGNDPNTWAGLSPFELTFCMQQKGIKDGKLTVERVKYLD